MKELRAAGVAAIAVMGLVTGVTAVAPASAATESVSVDLSTVTGPVNHVGQGFLYGLSQDGSAPADSVLQPLATTSFRGGGALDVAGEKGYAFGDSNFLPRYNMTAAQAKRVTKAPYNAVYDVLVSDLWGSDGFPDRASSIPEPCDNSDCSSWVSFLGELVSKLNADGLQNSSVRFDIWNEPIEPGAGSGFWPRSQAQYYQMWNTAVTTIRGLYPQAQIEGPSNPSFNAGQMGAWLDQAKSAGTLPNILSWHFSNDPVADAATAQSLLSARSITGVKLDINEYLSPSQQTPAYTAWYLARLQHSSVSWASHAIWSSCCGDASLDQTLVPAGAFLTPSGQYWTYRAGADQSGSVVSSTGSSDVDLVASRDDTAHKASILLGSPSGFTGTLSVSLSGLSAASYLPVNGLVRAIVQRIPQGSLSAPITVSNALVPVSGSSIALNVPWTASNDAYEVTLLPGNADSSAVDGNTTTGQNHFSYGANWGLTTGVSDMYNNTANWNYTGGAGATFSFYGNQVLLFAAKAADQGIMSLSIDGGTALTVDNYSASRNASALAWTSPLLALGTHTLTITNTMTKNPSSSGNNIAIDRADVPPSIAQVDGNQTGTGLSQFSYGTNWGVTGGVSDMFTGTANWNNSGGAPATFTFYGTGVDLYAAKASDQGVMLLSVDGGAPVTVDNYSASRNASALAWSSPTLTIGTHTLTITNTMTKNASSTGNNVAIDRADVR
ncbi:hypothetical protein ACPPVQ_03900 [Diaminobutyricibacter sp. McL0618]|uniref:hypothetical protein n=1 Tax=Leifsonia sp. McL0618 TaxID=3415677 RepID=UPI003CEE3945